MGIKMEDSLAGLSSKPLSNAEAAEWLGIRPDTLATWRYLGKGPRYFRAGARIKYFEDDLRAFLVRGEAA